MLQAASCRLSALGAVGPLAGAGSRSPQQQNKHLPRTQVCYELYFFAGCWVAHESCGPLSRSPCFAHSASELARGVREWLKHNQVGQSDALSCNVHCNGKMSEHVLGRVVFCSLIAGGAARISKACWRRLVGRRLVHQTGGCK